MSVVDEGVETLQGLQAKRDPLQEYRRVLELLRAGKKTEAQQLIGAIAQARREQTLQQLRSAEDAQTETVPTPRRRR